MSVPQQQIMTRFSAWNTDSC